MSPEAPQPVTTTKDAPPAKPPETSTLHRVTTQAQRPVILRLEATPFPSGTASGLTAEAEELLSR
jgi:hypothetical protein